MEADNEILRYAGELTREIAPGKPEPDTLTWSDSQEPDAVVVKYEEVRLPQTMRGTLTAKEWRPLLAASIVYHQELRKNWNKGPLFRLVIPLGLGEIPLVFALLYVFRMAQGGTAEIDLVLIIGIWILYVNSILWL
jgi:hypothetical protein